MLHGGEANGEGRLPFLQKGIVKILSEATHGLGVILEHRYYGQSFPTANLSTESLRFLTTEQALADSADFAQNVVFDGFEDVDLTAKGGNAPWIAYGGSYAGAQVVRSSSSFLFFLFFFFLVPYLFSYLMGRQ